MIFWGVCALMFAGNTVVSVRFPCKSKIVIRLALGFSKETMEKPVVS